MLFGDRASGIFEAIHNFEKVAVELVTSTLARFLRFQIINFQRIKVLCRFI